MNKFVNFRFWLLPFGNKHINIRYFHLFTDKSTGKSFLSGTTNGQHGQHGQLISPPLLGNVCNVTELKLSINYDQLKYVLIVSFMFPNQKCTRKIYTSAFCHRYFESESDLK